MRCYFPGVDVRLLFFPLCYSFVLLVWMFSGLVLFVIFYIVFRLIPLYFEH